jgi:hypothetical protein
MLFEVLLLSLVQQPYNVPFGAKPRCNVLYTGAPDRYEFFRIYEVSTGEIVLQSAIKGGDSKGVYVGSNKIKIEHKWAGDRDYHSAVVVECEKGNTIRI